MEDLSNLAKGSMWPTSQAAGNMQSSNKAAMTAPGSPPVDPLLPADEQSDPEVTFSGPELPVSHTGKPKPRPGAPGYGSPAWAKTSTPDPVRD